MPIYFAYGANMDIAAMARRCPASKPLGPARLANHRFFITTEGFASVRRAPGASVHGLLWDLALSDVAALDAYEEVGRGLYVKAMRPVIRAAGGTRQALVYLGRASEEGRPRPGYVENIVVSGEALGLPAAYLRGLAGLLQGAGRSGAPGAAPGTSLGHAGPVPGVRPRFATPFDRS